MTNITFLYQIFENLDKLDAQVSIHRRNAFERRLNDDMDWICRITVQNDNGEVSTKAERITFEAAIQAAYKNLGIAAVVDEG